MKLGKQIIVVGCTLILMFIFQGCPEEGGYELDTPMYIRNTTNDSLQIRPYLKTLVSISDSSLSTEDKEQIYLFINDSTRLFSLNPSETREWIRVSKERIIENPDGFYAFLINPDTLLNYSVSTWNGAAGVKRYFFYDLDDYEQINYTMEYP